MPQAPDTLRAPSPPPSHRPLREASGADEPRLRLLALLEELAGRLRDQRSEPALREYLALRRRLM